MFKQIIFPILLIAFFPIILKLMVKLRLLPAMLYAVLGNTLFLSWSAENRVLADGILLALLALTALSWLVTFYRKSAERFGFSRAQRQRKKFLSEQLRTAKSVGFTMDKIRVKCTDGLPIVKY